MTLLFISDLLKRREQTDGFIDELQRKHTHLQTIFNIRFAWILEQDTINRYAKAQWAIRTSRAVLIMASGLFSYILKYSKRDQLLLTAFTVLAFPFYYLSLDLPKTIVNDAINGSAFPVDLTIGLGGYSLNLATLTQIPYLLLLCFAFLALVLINGGFKYFINVYRGVLGERMLRRLRFQLIEVIMRFPLARFRRTSQGEIVSMVNQETEPLGAFIGESFSLPLYQGGMMLTILIFMFVQDWKLGIAAIALYPFQGWLIPRLQKQVNELNRERTVRIRKLAERLAETVAGIQEIHVNDNSVYFAAQYSRQLGKIYYTRVKIYKRKLLIKFLNSFIGQLTPFFFFSIGGLMVIQGDLSFGALIAVLAAYKDLSPPWKELLGWYQRQADYRMKYTLLMEQFDLSNPPIQTDRKLPESWLAQAQDLPIMAKNVNFTHSDGTREIDGVSLSIRPGEWLSLVGTGISGKSTLAHLFARLVHPSSGKIVVGEQDVASIPETIAGRGIGYVGHDSYLFATSIRDNILMSLKHRPQTVGVASVEQDDATAPANWQEEARRSGNSLINSNAQWVDFRGAGASDPDDLSHRLYAVLRLVGLENELVRYALARHIAPEYDPTLVQQILAARTLFRERIQSESLTTIVESFDPNQYNDNLSVAENILLGVANNDEFAVDGLSEHPLIRTLLNKHDLAHALDAAALTTAETMVELFSGLPPGHEFFERYSFVDADDLPALERILGQIEQPADIAKLNDSDRKLLRSLPYRIVVARHRLGVFGDSEKAKILAVRKSFFEQLDTQSRHSIDFFATDDYNASSTIGENIIFGRVVFGRLGAADMVHQLLLEVLESLDLLPKIIDVGLAAPSGIGGSQLPIAKQQKLALARALIKQPKILVVNEGLGALDEETLKLILYNLRINYPKLSLFWVDSQLRFEDLFNRVAYLESGRVVKQEELKEPDPEHSAIIKDDTVRRSDSIDEAEKAMLVNSIPLFRFLDDASSHLLASTCDTLDIKKGERLFNQGDSGDALYIVIDGKAGILISREGKEQQVQECGPNDVIGEMALLTGEARSASVEALSDLALLQLKRDVFIDLLQRNGEIGHQILQVVANRFSDSSRQLENLIKR